MLAGFLRRTALTIGAMLVSLSVAHAGALLTWDFVPSPVTVASTATVQMNAVLHNNSSVTYTVNVNGYGFNQDTLIGEWSQLPNRLLGPGPYLLTNSIPTLQQSFSALTLAPGGSSSFSFGTLTPIHSPVAAGSYSMNSDINFGSDWINSQNPFTVSVALPPTVSTLAKLANDVYGSNLGADGYSVTKLANDATTGFAANVYKNSSTNQVVVSVRGTDLNDSIDSGTYNLLADASFAKDGAASTLLLSYTQQLTTLIQGIHDTDPNSAITLTGHSLGGAVAQIVGNAAGVGVVSFDAPGAKNALTFTENQDLLAGLNGYRFNTPTTSITNIRLQGDEVSLVGKPVIAGGDSQLGTTVSVPNPNPNFNVWSISGNHKMATLEKQVEAYCPVTAAGCTSGYTGEANITGILIGGARAICNPLGFIGLPIPNFCEDFLISTLANNPNFIDPAPGNGYVFQEAVNSPFIDDITLPMLSDVFGWSLSYHDQFGWSPYSTQMGEDDFRFTTGVDALSFIPLNPFGNQTYNTDYFAYGLTFASDGTVNAMQATFGDVPEPESLALVLTALGALGIARFSGASRRQH